jgi:hypothetical protein
MEKTVCSSEPRYELEILLGNQEFRWQPAHHPNLPDSFWNCRWTARLLPEGPV